MKQRFSSLDIKVIAHELNQSLPSLRVSNIYDLSSRIFLFKFARPGHKASLVVDSGFRCHLTAFSRTTEAAPSPFVSRLRKFLKTRRVTRVAQVGTDRILELQFSDGQYRLFLEFYAGGNIVLCDASLTVISLLRNVSEGAEHEHVKLGSTYNLSERQNYGGIPAVTKQRVRDGLQQWIARQAAAEAAQSGKKARKTKGGDTLRKALANCINEFPPLLLEHALRVTGFDTTILPEAVVADESHLDRVLAALDEAAKTMDSIMSGDNIKGYIIGKAVAETGSEGIPQEQQEQGKKPKIMYNDFHPFLPVQFAADPALASIEFDNFNHAVDDFFSSIEGQKLESRLAEKEEAARKKLEHAKEDQQKRIGGLQEVQALNVRKAEAIEANLNRVEEAIAAVNSLIAQGMDWVEIDRLVELEQKRQNPVAQLIKLPLKLSENTATLLLSEWDAAADEVEEEEGYFTGSEPSDSEDEGAESRRDDREKKAEQTQDRRIAVDVDLGLSGWSNAREYYDQKKTAAAKEEKTLAASAKALKSATEKVQADLKKALKQEKTVLRPTRQPLWFEKFIYFVSSDGYLVLGAKDAVQSDILYQRHLKKGDIFVHADLNGACPAVIKNRAINPDDPIPPGTLTQAGNLSVATSSAWDSKAVMSAWWAPAERVTKNASTGDYLPPGKFEVRGEKTFLPPAQLLLGFAVMFQISDESKARHKKHQHRDDHSSKADDSAVALGSVEAKQPTAGADGNDTQGHNTAETNNKDDDVNNGDDDDEDEDDQDDQDDDDDKKAEDNADEEANNDEDNARRTYNNPLLSSQPPGNGGHDSPTHASREANIGRDSADARDEDDEDDRDDQEKEEDDDDDDSQAPSTTTAATKTSTQSKPSLPVRGKRGKNKKIATKYADQDDEDRDEAMRLLGSRTGQERAAAAATARAAAKHEAEAQKERRKQVMERHIREGREREEARLRQAGGDDLDDPNDDDNDQHSHAVDLDALIGTPLPGDDILAAMPVCAPWPALGRYKYKAKLQPGAQKKGKAVREILARWLAVADHKKGNLVDQQAADPERPWPRELELLRGWRDAEVIGVLPVAKVRVLMGGGAVAAAGSSKKGSGSGSANKGGGRGGRGSKKR